MEFNGLCLLSVFLVSSLNAVSGHQCLNLAPMDGFEMEKFFGLWYALKTTLPHSRCVVYDFYPEKVKLFKPNFTYDYFYGKLETNNRLPSDMTYLCNNLDFSDPERHRPPFVVVETDYVSYATVFMCIKMDTGRFRHYVSILSRTLDLDPKLLNDLTRDLIDVNETLQLKHVYHEDCNYESLVADTNDENVTDSENDDKKPYVTIKWMRQPTPEGGV